MTGPSLATSTSPVFDDSLSGPASTTLENSSPTFASLIIAFAVLLFALIFREKLTPFYAILRYSIHLARLLIALVKSMVFVVLHTAVAFIYCILAYIPEPAHTRLDIACRAAYRAFDAARVILVDLRILAQMLWPGFAQVARFDRVVETALGRIVASMVKVGLLFAVWYFAKNQGPMDLVINGVRVLGGFYVDLVTMGIRVLGWSLAAVVWSWHKLMCI